MRDWNVGVGVREASFTRARRLLGESGLSAPAS